MYDPDDSPLMLPGSDDDSYESEHEPSHDRMDEALNGITRFSGLFALGITVTLFVRWLPALLPFYWLSGIACLLALALPAYLSRSARLLALAIALIVAIFSGWFDQFAFTGQQVNQQVQSQVKELTK